MTYGQLKFRLIKAFAGVDPDLIEGWITDCYQEILGLLSWSRLDVQAMLVTTAPYATGTVAVTAGSSAITATGGVWTTQMSGLGFRVKGDSEEYQFAYASGTTGTLDRVYQGADNGAAAYSIYQNVYPLPANCRFVDEGGFGSLQKLATEEAQAELAGGLALGAPLVWWPYMDDASTPPQMQVRLFPTPDKVYGIPYTYCAEAPNPSGTSSTLLPWTQPAALIEGTTAKIKRHLKDYPGAQMAKAAFGDAVTIMISQEADRRGPTQMEVGSYYTAHRARRGRR